MSQLLYARLTNALYDRLGHWELVADICNHKTLTHKGAYYHGVAFGKFKPHKAARAGIIAAVKTVLADSLIALNLPPEHPTRLNVSYGHDLGSAMQELRLELEETWEEFGEASLRARLIGLGRSDQC